MSIDLQRFCANELHERDAPLRSPWYEDGWVYATNRHVVVRVKAGRAQTDVHERQKGAPKNVAELFAKYIDNRECEFLVMPPVTKMSPPLRCDSLDFFNEDLGCTRLGAAYYSTAYLSMLAELPQIRVCPGEAGFEGAKSADVSPAAFIFDGGQALLMPWRLAA